VATRTPTVSRIGTYAFTYTWNGLLNGDDGAVVDVSDLADMTFQVLSTGTTFGVGGAVQIEGSMTGVDFFVLKDPSNTAINLTAAGGRAVLEHPQKIRPRTTGGDGTTSINVVLFARRVGR
jgi:hypothetical protein